MDAKIKERVKANSISLYILALFNIGDLIYMLVNKNEYFTIDGQTSGGMVTATIVITILLTLIYAAVQCYIAKGYSAIVDGKSKKTGALKANKVMLCLAVLGILALAYAYFSKSFEITFIRGWMAVVEVWTYGEYLFYDKSVKEVLAA